jgi:hypothetical protein
MALGQNIQTRIVDHQRQPLAPLLLGPTNKPAPRLEAKGRIALWGGSVHSRATLPLGNIEDVEREVREVVPVLSEGGGYVFCNIHNILADIAPEKVIAMYRAVE